MAEEKQPEPKKPMTITEARDFKDQLQTLMQQTINEYQAATGLLVNSIDFVNQVDTSGKYVCHKVIARVHV